MKEEIAALHQQGIWTLVPMPPDKNLVGCSDNAAVQQVIDYLSTKFDIKDLAKAIKGQALADFLADHPIPADWKISDDLPDDEVLYIDIFPTWTMFFDGSARANRAGAGVVFMSPQRFQMAINLKITALELVTQLLQKFDTVTLEHVPRKENQMADSFANLALTMTLGEGKTVDVPICQRWVIPLVTKMLLDDANVISVLPIDAEEWRRPLIDYMEHRRLPDDPRHCSEIR
ncbi:uncharacterized protein LOC126622646 [Malus sylvestris]|uniref:uncharacterized protein LOC126622646 n=1 Tax=Malus sylvestris TaxID=3752 RepID=UPI0021AD0ADA|nr:uncharacterized protein LOC126622646 [Malus sylvestris]